MWKEKLIARYIYCLTHKEISQLHKLLAEVAESYGDNRLSKKAMRFAKRLNMLMKLKARRDEHNG